VVTTFTLAGYLGSLTKLFRFTQKLSAKIRHPVVHPARQAITNTSWAIRVDRLYKDFKRWVDPSSPESKPPAPEPLTSVPGKGKIPVQKEQPSTKEEGSKKSGLHRRLFRWRRRGDLDGGLQGRELEVDVERIAVTEEIKS
jgi:hypothetical protein